MRYKLGICSTKSIQIPATHYWSTNWTYNLRLGMSSIYYTQCSCAAEVTRCTPVTKKIKHKQTWQEQVWHKDEVNGTSINSSCEHYLWGCKRRWQCERCCKTGGAGCSNYRVFLSYHVFQTKKKAAASALICRPVLEVEIEDPSRSLLMHHVPPNRMQLWTFPSQRDNEVSSGAENEAVVCPGGRGGLWKQAEQGLCEGEHL